MEPNYFNRSGGVCGNGTDRRMLPEAELWTQVIVQAINDLDGQTSSMPGSAQDSAREWFASESDAVGSFIWSCNIINVDPHFVRSQIAKKQRMMKSKEPIPAMRQGAKALRGKDFAIGECGSVPSSFKRLVVQL